MDGEPSVDPLAEAGGQGLVGVRHSGVPGPAPGFGMGPAVEDRARRLRTAKAVVGVPEHFPGFGTDEERPVLPVPVEVPEPEDLRISRKQEVGVVLFVLLQRAERPAETEEILRAERLFAAQDEQPAGNEP